jgi:hypothetical protein
MQLDLAKDLVIIYGWAVSLSSIVVWVSAIIGFLANIIYNRATYMAMYRENKLTEIATDAFHMVEKAAKLTPMTSDDKLIELFKLSIQSYREIFGYKPSKKEIKYLKQKATALAAKDKAVKIKQAELLAANKGGDNA